MPWSKMTQEDVPHLDRAWGAGGGHTILAVKHGLDLINTLEPGASVGAEPGPELGHSACLYNAATADQATWAQATPGLTGSITDRVGSRPAGDPPHIPPQSRCAMFPCIIFGSDITQRTQGFHDTALNCLQLVPQKTDGFCSRYRRPRAKGR